MFGAILGDIIGQPFEFDRGNKSKEFPLFCKNPRFTDDSVMTIAICDGILKAGLDADENTMKTSMITSMQLWGHKYPHAGYGGRFETLERTREVARWSAEVTHNHPEGVKGAESTASVIWMARNGYTKPQITEYITKEFGYDLSRTCDQIRPDYHHVESCQETVPQAITAFLEGTSFEDVIRTAVSLGGDCDTLTDIAAAMGEAFFEMPAELKEKCFEFTTKDMHEVMERFEGVAEGKHSSVL